MTRAVLAKFTELTIVDSRVDNQSYQFVNCELY